MIVRHLAFSILLLGGCSPAEPERIVKSDVDPALAMALEDQILIDQTLSQQANEDVIRPPDRPVQILVPVDIEGNGSPPRKPGS